MKKLRKNAKVLLQAAHKVYHYRRDLMSAAHLAELEKASDEVQGLLKNKQADASAFAAATDRLDLLLRKVGGKIYPKTFLSDNIEVILVAAIIVIGIRTFFFQPFIIPTNSMYPTYSGMNAVVCTDAHTPNVIQKFWNLVTLGARHYSLTAQNSGPIELIVARTISGNEIPYYRIVDGRKWFGLMPAQQKQYDFLVGGVAHSLRVPAAFGLEATLQQTLLKDGFQGESRNLGNGLQAITVGHADETGDRILEFDITLGDALFVDRMSYHFRKPHAGDPFVFRTDAILDAVGRATNDYTPKYYIKRIGGVENETLEIINGSLYADGIPRFEVEAFERNARQEGAYGGYINEHLMAEGRQMRVPEDSYVALGDNSANSADSRYWGFVPDRSVIGKALFIYYPFTQRWGVSE